MRFKVRALAWSRVGSAAAMIGLAAAMGTGAALAQEQSFTLTIKEHRFDPARLEVPANVKFKLVVKNLDQERAEFESKPMKIEKIIAPGGTITVNVGPLKPGEYPFVEEFHEDVAKGVLVAK
jgi:hypothetical protein